MEAEGIKMSFSITFQDNTSKIKFAENGKLSSGKRTRHFDILLFHVADSIMRKEVIKCFPTVKTISDCFSKPLSGKLLRMMRRDVMSIALRE